MTMNSTAPAGGSNGVATSALTSTVMMICGIAATWLVKNGFGDVEQQAQIVNIMGGIALGGITGAIGWYKARTHTEAAVIAVVNDKIEGVKVVAADVPARTVKVPPATQGKSS